MVGGWLLGVVSVIVISTLFPFLSLYILVVMYIPFHLQGNRPRKKKGRKKEKKTDIVQGRRGRNSNPQRSRRARDDGDPSFGSRNGRYSGRTARQQTLFGYPVSQACTFFLLFVNCRHSFHLAFFISPSALFCTLFLHASFATLFFFIPSFSLSPWLSPPSL